MTSFTILTDAELDPDQPITSAKMKALRDNPIAIDEADPTAPKNGTGIISCKINLAATVPTVESLINEDGFTLSPAWGGSFLLLTISGSGGDWSLVDKFIVGSADISPTNVVLARVSGAGFRVDVRNLADVNQTSYSVNLTITYDRGSGDLPNP